MGHTTGITWKLVRNEESQPLPRTTEPVPAFLKHPQDICVHTEILEALFYVSLFDLNQYITCSMLTNSFS